VDEVAAFREGHRILRQEKETAALMWVLGALIWGVYFWAFLTRERD